MQLEEAGEQGEAACCISSINVSGLNLVLAVPRRGQRPFIEKTCRRVDVRHETKASGGGKTQDLDALQGSGIGKSDHFNWPPNFCSKVVESRWSKQVTVISVGRKQACYIHIRVFPCPSPVLV